MLGTSTRYFLVLTFSCALLRLCSADRNGTTSKGDVLKKWISLREHVMDIVNNITDTILPTISSINNEPDISTECLAALNKLFIGARDLKTWAISMLDASGKVSPGLLSGSLTDLGDYDECLSLDDRTKNSSKTFTGQYCTVEIKLPLPTIPRKLYFDTKILDVGTAIDEDDVFGYATSLLPVLYRISVRFGLCVPSTCRKEDARKIAKLASRTFPEVDVKVPRCETKDSSWKVTREQIVVLSFFGVLILINIICTFVDFVTKRRNPTGQFRRHFLHFSLRKNMTDFFGQTEPSSKVRLRVLDGIRLWCMVWICLGHTYGLFQLSALGGLKNFVDFLKQLWFAMFSNSWVSVDVFFLVSGVLVAYNTLGQLQRENGRMNFLKSIFRRLWRLTPGLLAVIGLIFLLPFLGSGPLWKESVTKQVELCRANWWLAALYANSWLGHAQACLVSSWYVSVDMHLYIISPIFIYAFYKSKPIGIVLCLVAILASCVAIFVLNVQYDLYPFLMLMTLNEETTEEVSTTIYFRPYAHVGPYMVGILFGCFIKSYPKLSARWYTVAGGWCLSVAMIGWVLIGPYHWIQGETPSVVTAAVFQSLHKTAFAWSVGWVIWASYYGYAGLVSTFLSWPGYRMLSQLLYLIYLVQLPVLWVRIGSMRKTMIVSHYNFFTEFWGILGLSTGVALILHLLVEAPFMSMDSAMFPKKKKKPLPVQNGQGQDVQFQLSECYTGEKVAEK